MPTTVKTKKKEKFYLPQSWMFWYLVVYDITSRRDVTPRYSDDDIPSFPDDYGEEAGHLDLSSLFSESNQTWYGGEEKRFINEECHCVLPNGENYICSLEYINFLDDFVEDILCLFRELKCSYPDYLSKVKKDFEIANEIFEWRLCKDHLGLDEKSSINALAEKVKDVITGTGRNNLYNTLERGYLDYDLIAEFDELETIRSKDYFERIHSKRQIQSCDRPLTPEPDHGIAYFALIVTLRTLSKSGRIFNCSRYHLSIKCHNIWSYKQKDFPLYSQIRDWTPAKYAPSGLTEHEENLYKELVGRPVFYHLFHNNQSITGKYDMTLAFDVLDSNFDSLKRIYEDFDIYSRNYREVVVKIKNAKDGNNRLKSLYRYINLENEYLIRHRHQYSAHIEECEFADEIEKIKRRSEVCNRFMEECFDNWSKREEKMLECSKVIKEDVHSGIGLVNIIRRTFRDHFWLVYSDGGEIKNIERLIDEVLQVNFHIALLIQEYVNVSQQDLSRYIPEKYATTGGKLPPELYDKLKDVCDIDGNIQKGKFTEFVDTLFKKNLIYPEGNSKSKLLNICLRHGLTLESFVNNGGLSNDEKNAITPKSVDFKKRFVFDKLRIDDNYIFTYGKEEVTKDFLVRTFTHNKGVGFSKWWSDLLLEYAKIELNKS